jgi:hypothetical protein
LRALQQQQQQAVCLQQQQQQQQQQTVYGLSDVPTLSAAVEAQKLGTFRFKGGALQQVQMANVTLSHLAGRARYIPAQPPRGKGERVAPETGTAAQGQVVLPALVQQYRSRVPVQILESQEILAAAAAAGEDAERDCMVARTGSLQTTSAPVPRGGKGSEGLGGVDGGEVDGSGFGKVEVLGLRQKSHSFTCPRSPGLM